MQKSAHTLMLLYDLLTEHNKMSKNAPIYWTKEQEELSSNRKTILPRQHSWPKPQHMLKYSSLLRLQTLRSCGVVSVVLYQKTDNKFIETLGFFSKRLDKAQIIWTIFSGELQVIYLGAKNFSYFLRGTNFTIQTGYQAIVRAAASSRPRDIPCEVPYLTAMYPKWQHITGSNNVTANALSRATAEKLTPASTTTPSCRCCLHIREMTLN